MDLEKIIILVKNRLKTGQFSDVVKNDLDKVFNDIIINNKQEEVMRGIFNIIEYLEKKPAEFKHEDKITLITNSCLKYFAMYGKNEKIAKVDKELLYLIINAMRGVNYNHYKLATDHLIDEKLNEMLLNYIMVDGCINEDMPKIVTNRLTDFFTQETLNSEYMTNKEKFMEYFIEKYANPRLNPRQEYLKKNQKTKEFMLSVMEEFKEKPAWKKRFEDKVHLLDELNQMTTASLDKFYQYDFYLRKHNCPSHHITNDELILIQISKCIEIAHLDVYTIDDKITKVCDLDLDDYKNALTGKKK